MTDETIPATQPAAGPPDASQPGQRPPQVGPYPVSALLGRGGMGQVLSVHDPALGREMAAKTLLDGATPAAAERFLIEARVTGQLEHPGIVAVHQLGNDAHGPFFTMQRVEGRTLQQVMRQGHLELAQLLDIFGRVCETIAFAHSRGVIHRDLKPDNIMIGAFGVVLVMDWGLAKVEGVDDPVADACRIDRGSLGGSEVKTMEGAIVGTPHYMSPQQAEGEAIDARADVYALGVILYEMLTGSRPFRGRTAIEVIQRVASDTLQPPRERAPERQVPRELDAITCRAMARDPEARYPTVEALHADIKAFLAGRLVGAASYSSGQLLWRWIQRHQSKLMGAVALIALLAIGARWAQRQADLERQRRIASAVAAAEQVFNGAPLAPELLALRAERGGADGVDDRGRPYAEAVDERRKRERSLRAYLTAVGKLEQARQLAPGDDKIRARRLQLGEELVTVATLGGDYTLARQAARDLDRHGASADQISALEAAIDEAEQAVARFRDARVKAIFDDLGAGLGRPDRQPDETLEDYVFELAGYRDRATLIELRRRMMPLVDRAAKAETPPVWRAGERDLLVASCRVLPRLDLDGVVEPLLSWAKVVRDPVLAEIAGRALCDTRRPLARRGLETLRERFGPGSATWAAISPLAGRVGFEDTSPESRDDLAAAEKLIGAHAPARALTLLRRRYGSGPWPLQARLLRAKARTLLFHLDAAEEIEADLRAVQSDPKLALSAKLVLAELRVAQANSRDAQKLLGEILERTPRQHQALHLRAFIALDAGDWNRAIADMQTLLESRPRDHRARAMLGLAHAYAGQRMAAIRALGEATAEARRNVHVHLIAARAYRQLGEQNHAQRAIEHARQLAPRSPQIAFERAEQQTGAARLATLRELVRDAPTFLRARLRLIDELSKQRATVGEARQLIDGALETYPGSAALWLRRGSLAANLGETRAARKALTEAITLDPALADAWHNRGLLARDLEKRPADARADLERAVELRPDMALWRVNLAICLGQLRFGERALEEVDRAIALQPELPLAHRTRGVILANLKRHKEAARSFARYLELVPGSAERPSLEPYIKQHLR